MAVVACLLCGPLEAAEIDPATKAFHSRAKKAIERKPGIIRSIGMAEMYRARGQFAEAQKQIASATLAGSDGADRAYANTLLCWRMLPVAPAKATAFDRQVSKLRNHTAPGPWLDVFALYQAHLRSDRKALLTAARALKEPSSFPIDRAEKAHFELLRELGLSQLKAGFEVITHRDFKPLHGLRDLDRGLTREAGFLRRDQREKDAIDLQKARDRLRQCWLKAATHLPEKLFALRLSGKWREQQALFKKARAVTYLQKPDELRRILTGLDPEGTWKSLIKPCLESDVRLVESPPDLSALRLPQRVSMRVSAKTRAFREKTAIYTGDVSVELGRLRIRSELLTVIADESTGEALLSGSSTVSVQGVPGVFGEVRADRFTFHTDSGTFTFGGRIEVDHGSGVRKYVTCTVSKDGTFLKAESLLDRFDSAPTATEKLALLPRITSVYEDRELPDGVAYFLALSLLRPHLTWHAPHHVPAQKGRKDLRKRASLERLEDTDESDWRWGEAHGAGDDAWFFTVDVPAAMTERLAAAYKAYERRVEREAKEAERVGRGVLLHSSLRDWDLIWRVDDLQNADVKRAERLLAQAVNARGAARWLAELRRNNTVLTADVMGAYARATDAPIVIDARNTDNVSCRLYRVRSPDTLRRVLTRIGNDFMFRDYGLTSSADAGLADAKAMEMAMQEAQDSIHRIPAMLTPELKKEDLLHKWETSVRELKVAPVDRYHWDEWYGYDDWDWEWAYEQDSEAEYYNDRCERFRRRIRKGYRKEVGERTSWHCDRVLRVPGKHLNEAGAYVLLMEANGQRAYAPLIVDPISLTLRRCRDGIFALVSDSDGMKPVEDAFVYGAKPGVERGSVSVKPAGMPNALSVPAPDARADNQGAAFAKVYGGGDRAILAWDPQSGRYAVGGFGDLFEGLYVAAYERRERLRELRHQLREATLQKESVGRVAHVYADRHVVAAYTDRPTYRPGQTAQFKLIVRCLPAAGKNAKKGVKGAANGTFRAEDFDLGSVLEVPKTGTQVSFAVINPRGRIVGSGELRLNDYGTAAGQVDLSEESATGIYNLKVTAGGMDRVVPSVFAVKHYRRPNFEVALTGVPAELKPGGPLQLELTGRYYFGKTLSSGKVDVRLVAPAEWRPIAQAHGELDATGGTSLKLALPADLGPGKYHVIASLTDDSGRTVSRSVAATVKGTPQEERKDWGLSALPRFLALNETATVRTHADAVVALKGKEEWTFRTSGNEARIKLASPGWHTLVADHERTEIFVYGGMKHPLDKDVDQRSRTKVKRDSQNGESRGLESNWVNLSYYLDERVDHPSDHWFDEYNFEEAPRYEDPEEHLMVLFGRHHANVGEKLKLLAYIPHTKPRLLFTIEGRTVADYHVTTSGSVSGYYHVIEIPIKERHLPNFYLRGRIIATGPVPARVEETEMQDEVLQAMKAEELEEAEDSSEDPRWCRVDVLDPNARPGGEKLKISITTAQKEYRPGERVDVEMKVADLNGEPREAEVSLGAVDESVYVFGEDQVDLLPGIFTSPRPPRRYMRKTWRSFVARKWGRRELARVMEQLQKKAQAQQAAMEMAQEALKSSVESLSDLRPSPGLARMRRTDLAEFGDVPVGEMPLARVRSDFRETATWQPQLRSDKSGVVTASFKLPDSLTAYRLTAVGLTKQTELGVGRSKIRSSLPLSIQLFLPRFAVEMDQLAAVALVHNRTDRAMDCTVRWEVEGAQPVGGADKQQIAMRVPANGSKPVRLSLRFDRVGEAQITVRAVSGQKGDAEARSIRVQALGRPMEVALSGAVDGSGSINLPEGFIANDLRVTLTRKSVARAMDGLEYLVAYPYGCVEQTMSRFLPAVMVARATSRGYLELPTAVSKKLPKVLEKGLERLYNFQHGDGGWGWWKNDQTNDRMTVYVVYGLARCKSTGTPVDNKVLKDACALLREKLKHGGLIRQHNGRQSLGVRDLAARAWLALSLAGEADLPGLSAFAESALRGHPNEESLCNLALACRAVGLNELGERLWARAKDWKAERTAELALHLTTQLGFGAPIEECYANSYKLLDRRKGHRWGSTRATAWAVEALSGMMRYARAPKPAKEVSISLDRQVLLNPRDPKELAKGCFEVRLASAQLPRNPVRQVRLAADFGEPALYGLTAHGYQRLEKVAPTGTTIRLRRSYETLKGDPVVKAVGVGKVIAVRLHLALQAPQDYLMIDEPRPSGFEFADDQVHGALASSAANAEFRDDRLCAFFTHLPAGNHEFVYYLRAETPGTSHVIPGRAFPMYNEKVRGETGSGSLRVE